MDGAGPRCPQSTDGATATDDLGDDERRGVPVPAMARC
jgi:hypothetical protein